MTRIVRWLQNLSIQQLYQFCQWFIPLLVVSLVINARYQAQYYLRDRADAYLKIAATKHHLLVSEDSVVQGFLAKHPVYLSLTSIPERIQYVPEILSTMDLSLVDRVIINLPRHCNRSSAPYTVPKQLLSMEKVEIHWLESDFGPITKLVPTLALSQQEKSNPIIIVIDDDVIYPIGMISAHIQALAHHPDRVSTTMPARLLRTNAKPPFSYQITGKHSDAIRNGLQTIVHGTGSYGFIANRIDQDWLKKILYRINAKEMTDCRLSDDLIVSMALWRFGTETILVANEGLAHGLLMPHPLASQKKPLSTSTISWLLDRVMQRIPLQLTQSRINVCLRALTDHDFT